MVFKCLLAAGLLLVGVATGLAELKFLGWLGTAKRNTAIHESPNPKSRTFYRLSQDDSLVFLESANKAWLKVLLKNGTQGFVSAADVERTRNVVAAESSGATRIIGTVGKIGSAEFFELVSSNEVAAKQWLQGLRISVRGVITRITFHPTRKTPVVLLSGGPTTLFGVALEFKKSDAKEISQLKVGWELDADAAYAGFDLNIQMGSARISGYSTPLK